MGGGEELLMPNFDAGSYFLTILAPVKQGAVPHDFGAEAGSWEARLRAVAKEEEKEISLTVDLATRMSWTQRLHMVLSTLPTALQSPATERIGVQSPFARNMRTHLCRLVVLDDVVYNGRVTSKPIIGRGGDPLVPQKVDSLNSSYLLFVADFDAITKDGAELPSTLTESEQDAVRDSYLTRLWDTAADEMRAVFENCVGFESVNSVADFVSYMKKCQVETTMPFHDYWIEPPALKSLPLKFMLATIILPLLVFALGLVVWLLGSAANVLMNVDWNMEKAFWAAVCGLAVSVVTIFIAYVWAMRQGQQPFPPPKYGDLPSVLKSLYLQQNFADFVIANQGASDDDLYAAFGAFVRDHKPTDKTAPTQKPGYISSRFPGAVQS